MSATKQHRYGPRTRCELAPRVFDRICRDNGIKHLLTAPRSPTTTGKVERFHKTLKAELLTGKTFESIVEAQAAIDAWLVHYNTARPHQGIGMVPPVERFRLAVADPLEPIGPAAVEVADLVPAGPDVEVVTRKVSSSGTISLDTFSYLVGRLLAGQTVQVTSRDGVLEISHRGLQVASHARRSRPGPAPAPRLTQNQPRRPATVGVPVVRKIDGSGSLLFAGHAYRVSNRFKRMSATVTVVGGTVQIAVDSSCAPTRSATTAPRNTAASPTRPANLTGSTPHHPAPPPMRCNAGTGATVERGYRTSTPQNRGHEGVRIESGLSVGSHGRHRRSSQQQATDTEE